MRAIGTGVDAWIGVSTERELQDLRDLIEELPECGSKAALRGMATACVALQDPRMPAHTLERMTRIVRKWRETDPLTRLAAELDQLGGGSDGR
jgi:hypothetical protein